MTGASDGCIYPRATDEAMTVLGLMRVEREGRAPPLSLTSAGAAASGESRGREAQEVKTGARIEKHPPPKQKVIFPRTLKGKLF